MELYESQFIQDIVEVIGNKLDHTWNRRLRVDDPYVVGIDNRVEGLNMWLEDGSSDVGVAVVYGMGGIGKTTIAKTAYNQNFYKFQGSSFLADIRATSKLPNGLVHLQRNLLSGLQKGKAKKIYSLDEGITKIKRAIRCKRVLIALDDVDNLEQFNAILGMREWLHPGSKIIITTRHEHLLKAHENCAMFKVKGLNENESLELFSWHAFRQPHPSEGHMDLSRPVVQHCGGVPLALQVLGSSLFGKAADVWKNALQNLDVITEGKIQKILRISFDSLQDHVKRLFLHIACFFIGKDKDFSTTVLDECEFATNIGIQNLVDRCLLIIDGFNKLTMHQLLQDMGGGIIREESPEDPGKRTRVWNKDASNVLRKLTGTETIKGLMLNIPMLIKDESSKITSSGSNRKRFHVEDYDGNCSSSRRRLGFFSWQSISFSSTNSFPVSNEIGFKTEAFRRMQNLELLLLDNVKISGGYEDFPKNLIWLSWRGFALKSIPTNFCLENLIALDLRNSSLQHVWKGTKFLPILKILNLSHSHGLVTTPDLSGSPNLEKLILKDCINLKEVDESIGDLEKLVFMNLKDCKNLMKLPIRISMLRSLQKLILSGCSNLVLPASKIVENQSDSTPSDMKKLSLWQSMRSWVLPRKNLQLTSASWPQFLKSLDMAYCNLSEIPNDLPSSLSSLERLNLDGNPFLSLPVNLNGLSKLHRLSLDMCQNLEMIPELPPSVEDLIATRCTSLKRVLLNLPDMLPIIRLAIMACENVVEIQNVLKTRPLRSVDIEMIKDIGLFNLESIGSTEVEMYDYLTCTERKGPLQGLDECGIFSIFLPGSEVPDWFRYKSSMGNSELSVTIPPHLNLKIRGLNACVVYARASLLASFISSSSSAIKTFPLSSKHSSLAWNPSPHGDKSMTLLLTFLSICIDPTLLFLSVIMLYIWKGTRFLLGLKILNLSHSHSLVTTPDLSGVPNLEKLILKDCINLVVIDESLGNLEKLIFLNLKDCRSLMKLPTRISMFRSLQELDLSGCSKLVLNTSTTAANHLHSTTRALYECAIISIFVHGNKIPDWFTYRSMGNSVLSIILPSHLNLKIRGLNVCVMYSRRPFWFSATNFLKVSNETKGLKWTYCPVAAGLPKKNQDMLWLSHWRFENDELEEGEQEFGIQLVYEETPPSPWTSQNDVGDVSVSASKYQLWKGKYLLSNTSFYHNHQFHFRMIQENPAHLDFSYQPSGT
ncbi:PREDICTED: TMV resistance protein N-like [Prunus mume]|uniref:ADP-ribosyl cyclase/cyclic ADP-ribose hydrolase n=1 Tax=Prunus mume TaxID=102107 RepID=A0ABM1LN88_PRUMU|nr:PREDICTED: TMV resistance protein N-like [Prunus mume]